MHGSAEEKLEIIRGGEKIERAKSYHRRKIVITFFGMILVLALLGVRLTKLMIGDSEYYASLAQDLHERERTIKAQRGRILDRNGVVLADNRTVCTISVIHSQIRDPEQVIKVLTKELKLDETAVRKRVEKVSSIERIAKNVEKEAGDRIREYDLAGGKVDEDYRRYYPFGSMASKVLGFTGGDNQGIIGLEVEYDRVLEGMPGKILTLTDARGVELENTGESRLEPEEGLDLKISLDANIQKFAEQAADKVMDQKQAESVSVIILNPKNGELYAMTNVPEFDLNNPYELTGVLQEKTKAGDSDSLQNALNRMWRNGCLNDTYEPGSTFKIITAAAGLEAGVVTLQDTFSCPGFKIVEDRRIRCHKVGGHGAETFVQATQNSCNPVFIEIGLRLGAERYFSYFRQFGLNEKTGVDLPGEAATIMHREENVGQVELATISFGQSFQITPIQLAVTVSSLINGGRRVTPHFGTAVSDREQTKAEELVYPVKEGIVSSETSGQIREILEKVVSLGSGKNAGIQGYHIGGKTATSQTLPRNSCRYISSFLGFAPAENPQVLGLCIIHDPKGVYYGGTVAAPVIRSIFENILPYLGIEKTGENSSEG